MNTASEGDLLLLFFFELKEKVKCRACCCFFFCVSPFISPLYLVVFLLETKVSGQLGIWI